MPTYEYQCHNCGATKVILRPIAEREKLPYCDNPDCGSPQPWAMGRLFSAPAIHFNGPGFPGNDAKIKEWATGKLKARAQE